MRVVSRLFLRLLAVVYLIAFLSLWVQVEGLVGSQGILPVGQFLDWVRTQVGTERYWLLPTLCWIDARDGALDLLCGGGALLSLLFLLDVAPALLLALLWAFYLSLASAGQLFLGYQWDNLLLETGFLAIFLASPRLGPRPLRDPPPSPIALGLLRWLLFRLMFSSGVVKLRSGDATWRSLTALRFHYETQPLPTWIGWYAHQLPSWFQTASCALMFVIELAVPLLFFAPRRIRLAACGATVGLQLLIAATGNYCFFNLLALALCLLLLDDEALPRWLRERADPEAREGAPGRRWPLWVLAPVAALVAAVSGIEMWGTLGLGGAWPGPVVAVYRLVAPFRSINSYGLFAVMTTSRPEVVVEGSDDGVTWRPYELPWKPGDVHRPPAFVAPHQPRLDWQMWFAALGTCQDNPWLLNAMARIQDGSLPVLGLLAGNPFPGRPPRRIRAVVYDYHFTDLASRGRDRAWWQRERKGLYCPELALKAESP